jgi:hypothetical protein
VTYNIILAQSHEGEQVVFTFPKFYVRLNYYLFAETCMEVNEGEIGWQIE